MNEIPEYLRIYISWIELYIRQAKEMGLSEECIQTLLETYRAPVSIDDYMFITYSHDNVDGCLERDVQCFRQ